MAPWHCSACRPLKRAASDAIALAIEMSRGAIVAAARRTAGRAKASSLSASARWCFTAWNEPIGTPNCSRCFT